MLYMTLVRRYWETFLSLIVSLVLYLPCKHLAGSHVRPSHFSCCVAATILTAHVSPAFDFCSTAPKRMLFSVSRSLHVTCVHQIWSQLMLAYCCNATYFAPDWGFLTLLLFLILQHSLYYHSLVCRGSKFWQLSIWSQPPLYSSFSKL